MKELSFERMEGVQGGWAGECFFAIPLLAASNPFFTPGWYATSTARVAYCWVT